MRLKIQVLAPCKNLIAQARRNQESRGTDTGVLDEPEISALLGALFFLTLHAPKAWLCRLFQIKFHTSLVETAGFAKG